MSGPEESRPQQRLAWLLLIGQRLKQEYDAIAKPLPAPLALLLQRLEARVGTARQDAGLPPGTNRGDTAGTPDDGR
jgi:hypothetical protein